MNFKAFATNEKDELEGIWKELGDGAAIRVARADNVEYTAFIRRKLAPYRSSVGLASLTDEESRDIFMEAMATFILLDWRNLQDEPGVDFPYSVENALLMLVKYKEFYKIVDVVSKDITNYRERAIAEVQENIKKQ